MALGNSTLTVSMSASASKSVGGSTLTGRTDISQILALVDGAGAGAADDIVDTTITGDNAAVALNTMTTTLGEAVSAQTKIKAVFVLNNSTTSCTVASSVSGFPSGTLGGTASSSLPSMIFYSNPTATGLTCTGASTITINNSSTPAGTCRVILFLA